MLNLEKERFSDRWRTPRWLFDGLNKVLEFDIDVAADKSNALCEYYFTREIDGLKQDWSGRRCFMNPPFSKAGWWAKKAAESNALFVLGIMPVSTCSLWWNHHVVNAQALVITHTGRVPFFHPELAMSLNNNRQDTCLIIWGFENNWRIEHAESLRGISSLIHRLYVESNSVDDICHPPEQR